MSSVNLHKSHLPPVKQQFSAVAMSGTISIRNYWSSGTFPRLNLVIAIVRAG